jgi:ankyrin repeat protein
VNSKRFYFNFVTSVFLAAAFSAALGAVDTADFFLAIKNDNPDQVAEQLRAGIDPNAADENGESALVSALRYQSYRVADLLLRLPGVDPDGASTRGETPLMLAAHWGKKDIVEKLIGRGVRVNRPGWTALHYAASEGHADVVRLLLDSGAEADAESPALITPLMMAARGGHGEICNLLLRAGADPARTSDAGLSAADFAARSNEADLAKQLARLQSIRRSQQ